MRTQPDPSDAGAADVDIIAAFAERGPPMAHSTSNSLHRLARATAFSVAGLRAAWMHEPAFRQECIATLVLAPVALWLGTTPVERALLIGTCVLVVIVELLNSGLEAVVDRIGTDRHALAARAKDLGSAAVFMSLMLVVAVWLLVAYGRFAAS